MMKAYIVVRLVPGLEANTLSQISSLPGGSRMVINQIRGLQGVQTTETLIGSML